MNEKELAKLLASNPDLSVLGQDKSQGVIVRGPLESFRQTMLSAGAVEVEAAKPVTIIIPDERAPGWNNVMRAHWAIRNDLVDSVWMSVLVALCNAPYKLFDCVVDVHVEATFKGQSLDSDNICAKLYIDALKGKLIRDDDARYIRRVTTESKRGKRNSVTIVLTPCEG